MSVSTEAGWGYDWGTPWSGPGQTTSMAGVEDNAANATVSPEMTRVESYEWVVIPSIVLLVSHSSFHRNVDVKSMKQCVACVESFIRH